MTQCNGIRLLVLPRIKCMLAYLLGVSFRWEEPNYSGDCRLDLHQEQVNTIENGKQIPTQWGFLSVGRISLYETVERGRDRVHADTPQWHIPLQQPRLLVVRVWHISCNAVIGHNHFTILSSTRSAPCVSGLEIQRS